MFPWTPRMQFRQPYQKIFVESLLNIWKTWKNDIYFRKKCSKISSGHLEGSFDNPAEKFSLKIRRKM